ncbi:MAG: LPS export ABC transporter permease LptF [Deltaproteobacteria bacterium]|nr:LPS export ABC transporter permease LptF [Deltaproteobacteria bacterium]
MPRIIHRYLLREILHPFGVSLLAFTAIVFSGRLMQITQMIVARGVGLGEILQSCLYLLPFLLVFTLPMAATVGIMLALMRLSVDHEIIALKSAGLSYRQLMLPILAFALATGLLTLFLTTYASPWGQRATRVLLTEMVKRRADLGIKEQVFNNDFQGMTLFVNQVSDKDGRLSGIFLYDARDRQNPHALYAERGQVRFDPVQEALNLNLEEGWIIRWARDPDRRETLQFKTYQIPLELLALNLKGLKSEVEMYIPDLWRAISEQRPGSERYNRLVVELHQRFALPLGALLLCLLAMPLGLSPIQHGRTWGLIMGLLVFLLYYIAFTVSWRLAVKAHLNPALAPWLADLIFVVIAAYLWRRTVKELPLLPAVLSARYWLTAFSRRARQES